MKKRKTTNKTKLPLLEPVHYLGWAIMTGAIIGVFHLLQVHGLHTPLWRVLVLYGVIAGVDTLNHVLRIQ